MIEGLIAFGAFAVGTLISWFILKNKYEIQNNAIENEANIKIMSLQNSIDSLNKNTQKRIDDLQKTNDTFLKSKDEQISTLNNTILKKEDEYKNLNKEYTELKSLNSKITTQLSEQKESLEDKIELLKSSEKKLKLEFENLANKIFEENKKQSNESLNLLLKPFKEQLNSFNTRVNDIYTDETKQRTSLMNEIKYLKDLNIQVSQDANNLALALKGENKTQGDWGEMILSRVLEQSGLKEGREYSVQGSFKSQDGKNQRPDVVVHLPAKKDIVIDSKVSLTSYIEYTEASNEEEKNMAIKKLMQSLNSHVKDLSSKKYEDLPELGTLDFVLMFIPIEGAFMLASSSDNKLFNLAFQSNIMIVSPSTLFVSLRTIENIWKVQDQNDNAKLIAKKAADLYDKFEGFIGDMEDLGKSIQKSNTSYENAFSKLTTGRGNLMRRTEEFKKLGVKPKKNLKIIDEKE